MASELNSSVIETTLGRKSEVPLASSHSAASSDALALSGPQPYQIQNEGLDVLYMLALLPSAVVHLGDLCMSLHLHKRGNEKTSSQKTEGGPSRKMQINELKQLGGSSDQIASLLLRKGEKRRQFGGLAPRWGWEVVGERGQGRNHLFVSPCRSTGDCSWPVGCYT